MASGSRVYKVTAAASRIEQRLSPFLWVDLIILQVPWEHHGAKNIRDERTPKVPSLFFPSRTTTSTAFACGKIKMHRQRMGFFSWTTKKLSTILEKQITHVHTEDGSNAFHFCNQNILLNANHDRAHAWWLCRTSTRVPSIWEFSLWQKVS